MTPKVFAYHLEGPRVPIMVLVPQVGNLCNYGIKRCAECFLMKYVYTYTLNTVWVNMLFNFQGRRGRPPKNPPAAKEEAASEESPEDAE